MAKKIQTFEKFDLEKLRPIIESCGGGYSSCGGGYSSREESEEERIKKNIAKRKKKMEIITNTCNDCDAELVKGAKFCHECGAKKK